ncbi:MAG: class I SAM-dependent methyltransferase [Patescibacteria group bacterium]|nr:class I SAM-dependent methyltransferase [Patescibacteria group bacterium]
MNNSFFYLFFQLSELFILLLICIYLLSLIYSSLKGSPFVGTNFKELELILKEADLKKNQRFYDLGCGDGRVVRMAVKKYGVIGVGIDINPVLILMAKVLTKIQKLKNVKFIKDEISMVNLNNADIVYIFLMPDLIKKISSQFKKQLKPKTLIISHGFEIPDFKNYLQKTLDHKPFPTYYYLTK